MQAEFVVPQQLEVTSPPTRPKVWQKINKLWQGAHFWRKEPTPSPAQPPEPHFTAEQQQRIETITAFLQSSDHYNAKKHAAYARELAEMAVSKRLPDESLIGNEKIWKENFQDRLEHLGNLLKKDGQITLAQLFAETPINDEVGGFMEEVEKFKRLPVFVGMSLETAQFILQNNKTVNSIGNLVNSLENLSELPRAKTYLTDVTSARANLAFGTFDITAATRYGEVILEFSQLSLPEAALFSTLDFNEILGQLRIMEGLPEQTEIHNLDINKTYEDPRINRLIEKAKHYYQGSFLTLEGCAKLFALYRRLSALNPTYPDPYRCEYKRNLFKDSEVMVPFEFPESPVGITSLSFKQSQEPILKEKLSTDFPLTLAPDSLSYKEAPYYINQQLVKPHSS